MCVQKHSKVPLLYNMGFSGFLKETPVCKKKTHHKNIQKSRAKGQKLAQSLGPKQGSRTVGTFFFFFFSFFLFFSSPFLDFPDRLRNVVGSHHMQKAYEKIPRGKKKSYTKNP